MKRWSTVEEAADYFSIKKKTLYESQKTPGF